MSTPAPIRIVVASREDQQGFFEKTATGRSLKLYNPDTYQLMLAPKNSVGLPFFYNKVIDYCKTNPGILVFMHDDLHLCDFDWAQKIREALTQFEIVGLAGSTRREPKQSAWAFGGDDVKALTQPNEHLSGTVGHGTGFPPECINVFGPSKQEVKLLDGLMIFAHSDTLHRHGVRFDERFSFHFYDMDFCREAEAKGVRMGTWPISVVHESHGGYESATWEAAYAKYLEKWVE